MLRLKRTLLHSQSHGSDRTDVPAKHRICCRLIVLWLFLALYISAGMCAYGQPAADALLQRIRTKMASNLDRLPNYTCTEAIERSVRDPGKDFRHIDTVRLEVAFVAGKELVSWPGAAKFDDKDIRNFVPNNGAIGTGNFAIAAHNIFRSNAPIFSGPFEEGLNGRKIIRYDFKVPLALSDLRVETNLHGAVVGYHGSFRVDADTLDLLRFETQSDEIPEDVEIAATYDLVEYASVRIGSAGFLLPVASELKMTRRTGEESVNRTRFSNCRQYLGESNISFADPAPVAERPQIPRIVQLPPNLSVETALTSAIDLGTAAIGDSMSLVLTTAVKKGSTTLAPKGALLRARLMRLDKQASREGPFYVVGFRLTSLDTADTHAEISANLQEAGIGDQYYVPFSTEDRLPSIWTYVTPTIRRPVAGEGVLCVRVAIQKPMLPAGLRMLWQTLK